MCARWGAEHNLPPSHFASFAAETVAALADEEADASGHGLLALPLHARMAAEAIADEAMTDAAHQPEMRSRVIPNRAFTLLDLYRQFMKKKFRVCMTKHGLRGCNIKSIINVHDLFAYHHQNYAMLLLLSDATTLGADRYIFQENVGMLSKFLKIEKIGIVRMSESGVPQFVHRSFAEHFAAQWLRAHAHTTTAKEMLQSLYKRSGNTLVIRFLELNLLEDDAGGQRETLPLHKAALAEDDDGVARALAEGARVDAVDGGGRLALHLAARRGMQQSVEALLKAGRNPNHRDTLLGWTPIQYLNWAQAPYLRKNKSVKTVEALAAAGADLAEFSFQEKEYILSIAARNDCPNLVLWSLGQMEGGCLYAEALEQAVKFNSINVVRVLLQSGENACGERKGEGQEDAILVREAEECQNSYWDGHFTLIGEVFSTPLKVTWKKSKKKLRTFLKRDDSLKSAREQLCGRGGDHQEALKSALRSSLYVGGESALLLMQHLTNLHGINEFSSKDGTLLHQAVQNGDFAAAEWLIHKGADPRARDSSGMQPLHYTLYFYDTEQEHRIANLVTLLLTSGADPNCEDEDGVRPLHLAARKGTKTIIDLLISSGADYSAQNVDGLVPLHYAARVGDVSIIWSLITKGANPRVQDNKKRLPLHYTSSADAVDLLVSSAAGNGGTAPYDALAVPELKRVQGASKTDVNALDEDGRTPLHLAAERGNGGVVEALLARGSKIEARDRWRNTPLHLSVGRGRVETTKLLVSHGSDVDAKDMRLRTPLHLAAQRGTGEVVRCLLDYGAQVNSTDEKGCTPYHLSMTNWTVECAEALLAGGADPQKVDLSGRGPMNYIYKSQFPSYGPDQKLPFVEICLREGSDTNLVDESGYAPLHHAVKQCDLEVVEILLEYEASVNIQDEQGRTPLDLANQRSAVYPSNICFTNICAALTRAATNQLLEAPQSSSSAHL